MAVLTYTVRLRFSLEKEYRRIRPCTVHRQTEHRLWTAGRIPGDYRKLGLARLSISIGRLNRSPDKVPDRKRTSR